MLSKPPEPLGVSHWSARLLAEELGIGNGTVAKIWRLRYEESAKGGHQPRGLKSAPLVS